MKDDVSRHFDRLAPQWDAMTSHPPSRIDHVLAFVGDIRDKTVIDAGSGTGILIPRLLELAGPAGRVIALDISPRMIEISRAKHSAPNLDFATADFLEWSPPVLAGLVVAYSCFPHFGEPSAFWRAAASMLSPGGMVLVAHIEGRDAINRMHRAGAEAVSSALPPAAELAGHAAGCGFRTVSMEDNGEYFVLLARLAG